MPATSVAQRQLMAIAEHHPSEVYQRNRGVLKMTGQQLHDFAATKQKGLPERVKKKKAKPRSGEVRVAQRKKVNRGRPYDGTKETNPVQPVRAAWEGRRPEREGRR